MQNGNLSIFLVALGPLLFLMSALVPRAWANARPQLMGRLAVAASVAGIDFIVGRRVDVDYGRNNRAEFVWRWRF